ncbi:hypothetical protein EV644_13315 [Kribbella orskensis]|uniref:DUF1844 domain-containing protein n=1 Tax=Kribbella orskensis TaxID=2512216 RepID=A0ABY2B7Y1_9ACTN|nr:MULTISPECIES: DUF1844 domain-containing protein [Kribbella]TCN30478.1 hypothetical protein EV642_13515 [Kribbella sp. VKM Ac-2500]TCO11120.1 hypothetical protein EV644_13315 [Kribbella orskensis]
MTDPVSTPLDPAPTQPAEQPSAQTSGQSRVDPMSTVSRDIAEVPSVEIISTAALHLMSAAAVNLGLAEDLPEHKDLDEARSLIDALAGLLDASAQSLGHHHAAPLRDGLRSLQLAFKEASTIPDEPGAGPGEKYTGEVHPAASRRR